MHLPAAACTRKRVVRDAGRARAVADQLSIAGAAGAEIGQRQQRKAVEHCHRDHLHTNQRAAAAKSTPGDLSLWRKSSQAGDVTATICCGREASMWGEAVVAAFSSAEV